MLRFSAMVLSLYTCPKPVVASMHGACARRAGASYRCAPTGGCCGARAITGLNEVKVGVPLPFGVALIVRDAVPRSCADPPWRSLGRNFSDEAAVAAGLADELADAGDVGDDLPGASPRIPSEGRRSPSP